MHLQKKTLSRKNINTIFSYFFILLITAGIGNAILNGTLLAGWKQAILIVAYLLCFSITNKSIKLLRFFIIIIFLQISLILTSIIFGMNPNIVIYNLFYYSAWIPFFIWASTGGANHYLTNYGKLTFYLVIICGIGLIIDLKTDIFSFLMSRSKELDSDYFLRHSEVVKRSAFIFTTSTLVMPVLGGMIVIGLLDNLSIIRISISLLVMLIAIVTSATANSFVVSTGLLLGILLQTKKNLTRMVKYIAVFFIAFYVIIPIIGDNDLISKHIDQIIQHQSLDSVANIGRIWHWERAFYNILDFSFIEHLFGSGLGSTNENLGNQNVIHTHGESSFLQAYLEGGLFGLYLRILPFIFVVIFFLKPNNHENRPFIIIGYCITVFLVDAVAPIFGNIPSQVLLGFLIGTLASYQRAYTAQIRR